MGQNPIAVLRMICHGRPVFLLCVQRVRVFDGHRLILTQNFPVCRARLTAHHGQIILSKIYPKSLSNLSGSLCFVVDNSLIKYAIKLYKDFLDIGFILC